MQRRPMMACTPIIRVVLIFTLILDDRQLLDASYLVKIPEYQLSESAQPSYSCTFNFEVDCLWSTNGKAINISRYNYKWKTGNGRATHDCSIEGKSNQTKTLSSIENKVECVGIAVPDSIVVQIGGSIKLECSSANRSECIWKRNEDEIQIDGRYNYIQDEICSIRISGIQSMDLSIWQCLEKSQQRPTAFYILALHSSIGDRRKNIEATTHVTPKNEWIIVYSVVGVAVVVLATLTFYFFRRHQQRKQRDASGEMHNTISFNMESEEMVYPTRL